MIASFSQGVPESNDNLQDTNARSADETDVFAWLSGDSEPRHGGELPPLSGTEMKVLALTIYQCRRDRDRFFEHGLFSDPAWDIMLAAYCLPQPDRPLSATGLCYAAAVPRTTALRWIDHLCDIDILSREPSTTDHRVVFVSLSLQGQERMEAYLNRFSRRLAELDQDG